MYRLPLVVIVLSLAPVIAVAQQVKPVEGSVQIGSKTYKLTHAVAYEDRSDSTPRTVVLLADRVIDSAGLAKVLRENEGSGNNFDLRTPHLKLTFEKDQRTKFFAYASGTSIGGPRGKIVGSVKVESGRAEGKANLASEGKEEFQIAFDVSFNAPLVGSGAAESQPAVELAKLGVTGKFVGNGKEGKLNFISAAPREAFADKPALRIIMTEKDHTRDPRAEMKAGFGDFGNALIISCHEDGRIFGCEVVHTAHSKKGFSSVGSIETLEFQIAGGQVQGKLRTDGEQEFFGDKWSVDLAFAAKYTPPAATTPSKPAIGTKSKTESPTVITNPAESKPTKPAAPQLKAKDLVILQGVENVEYKKLTRHIKFASTKNFKVLAAELQKQLATQGWQADGSDLIGVSAIIKRKRGDASLTIFVKPDGTGSTVGIHSEGLDFSE